MMSTEENILKGLLSVIEHISDARFQQTAWVENKAHPYAFFEETMHQLFDDYEFAEVLNNYKDYGISDDQFKVLICFYKAIDRYSEDNMLWLQAVDPQKIVADPTWHEIQEMAKEVLKAFNYKKDRA